MANFAQPAKVAEKKLYVQLRKVARIVGGIIESHVEGERILTPRAMATALEAYSAALGPWGETITGKIMDNLKAGNARAWASASARLGRELRSEFANSVVGAVARNLQRDQVELIKSLPLEAGLRAQNLAQEAMITGQRAEEIAAKLAATEKVTIGRAKNIARTEIAKANAAMTRARAEYVGAAEYYWRTAGDEAVRESHAALEGHKFRFDDPPEIEGEGAHGPGEFPGCRCYASPVIEVD